MGPLSWPLVERLDALGKKYRSKMNEMKKGHDERYKIQSFDDIFPLSLYLRYKYGSVCKIC